jgi:Ser/Thr protein kinase RdoA (MazF antagonist)
MSAQSRRASPSEISRAMAAYSELADPEIRPLPSGLVNESFAVRDGEDEYVLQRVNPIFSPRIHDNIAVVTEHLRRKGVATPRLVPTAAGDRFAELGEGGRWRLLTGEPGVGFDICSGAEQARAAGAAVAVFHSALADLEADLHPLGFPYHDTALHLQQLRDALQRHRGHRLHSAVDRLAEEMFRAAREWRDLSTLPRRLIHGDLKFSNILFAGSDPPASHRALSLIDLDTLSRMPLYVDLGDAWRSWCNRRGEDDAEAELDMEIFRASAEGYLGSLSLDLDAAELASLAEGLERISLELAARFAADALNETYYAWDPECFASAGEHNLIRARGQLSLHAQALETRSQRLDFLLAAASGSAEGAGSPS